MKRLMMALVILLACAGVTARAEEAARAYVGESFAWEYAKEVAPQLAETVPVYAAPSEDAWRGANGEAAVSLAEPLTVLGVMKDSDWLLIEYEISATERRIGYIYSNDRWSPWVRGLSLAGIVAHTSGETVMTDDPRASGRAMAVLHADELVCVLGRVGEDLFYVEATVDGKTAHGFVPCSAVALPEMSPLTDVMETLEGVWGFYGGAEVLGYGAIFTADGSLLLCDTDDDMETPPTRLIPDEDLRATYAVYRTDAEDRRFWSEYVITLEMDESRQVYGLSFYPEEDGDPECIHIEWGPSGGFYARYETPPEMVDDD